MKTKLILNSALSILVALGAVACSSGGGGSATSGLKNPVEKVTKEAKKTVDTAKQDAKKVADKAKDEVKQSAEKLENKTKQVIDNSKDKVSQATENTKEKLEKSQKQDDVKVPADVAKTEEKKEAPKAPADVAKQEEPKAPADVAKQEDPKAPADVAKQEDPKAPADVAKQEDPKAPADVAKQEEPKAPADVAKQEDPKAPADVAKQEEPKQPAEPTENEVENQILDEKPGVYASLTSLKNGTLDLPKLETVVKDNISYSAAGQLLLASDDGKYGTTNDAILYLVSDDVKMLMTLTNPSVNGWQYQTFAKFDDRTANTSGFVSLGNKSKPSDIQQSGNATYQGKLLGYFATEELQGSTLADVTVDVDFATKKVAFKTENTQLTNQPKDILDLTGSATLDAAKNKFVDGKVHLRSLSSKGQLEGALFGPKAEEVGGTFNIQNGVYIGAFGAKQK